MGAIEYDFEVVGGGFDGVPALAWRDDGAHPPPDVIFIGVCRAGMHCGTAKCRRAVAHVSYWLQDEGERPVGALAYAKQDEFVLRDAGDELRGRAVYVIGGLLAPANFGAAARVPIESIEDELARLSGPMVTA